VHRNLAVDQIEGNLARRLWVQVPVNHEAEKSEAKRESIDLQPHHLAARAPSVRCRAEERERKEPTVNLAGSQGAERRLRLNKGRGNPQRKKAREPHRRGHNKLLIFVAAPEKNSGAALFEQGF
jgi:hypothetical protein